MMCKLLEAIIRLSTSFGKMTKLKYEAGMAQRATFHLTAVTREGCTKCIMIHSSEVHLELMEIRYNYSPRFARGKTSELSVSELLTICEFFSLST